MLTFLGIDQSTSATKVVLVDETGRLLDKASRPHRQIHPRPGWVEHDAEEIWSSVRWCLGEIVERNRAHLPSIACLSITNQRETILVFDRDTGEPLHHAIVWQCRRGEPICAELLEGGYGDMVRQKTGLKIDTYFSASKITWLMRHHPELRGKLASGEALIGTIDTYLIYRLTQGRTHATDQTNASRTLLFDVKSLTWDPQLCELFQVPVRALPEIRESTARFGDTTIDGVLETSRPICGVIGDSQGALFAQRCFVPGMAKVTFGSGSSVLLNVGDRMPPLRAGSVSALAWVRDGRPTYALEGLINCTGATVSWLQERLELIESAEESEQLATSVDDCGGVYLIPAFAGLGAPYWRPLARASISGLTTHSDRRHVVRAGLESIAYQVRDVLEMMEREGGTDLGLICADGGATTNRFLMQFTADVLGQELRVSDIPDLSVLGALMMGMWGMEVLDPLRHDAGLIRRATTYRPAMSPDQANALYAGWQHAVALALGDDGRGVARVHERWP